MSGIEDFAGKDTCFVDPGSTSGSPHPSAGLISSGVASSGKEADISKALKPIYAGSHDASALSVKSGQCEVGFAMQSMVEDTLPGKGELQAGELKISLEIRDDSRLCLRGSQQARRLRCSQADSSLHGASQRRTTSSPRDTAPAKNA